MDGKKGKIYMTERGKILYRRNAHPARQPVPTCRNNDSTGAGKKQVSAAQSTRKTLKE